MAWSNVKAFVEVHVGTHGGDVFCMLTVMTSRPNDFAAACAKCLDPRL